MRQDALLAKTYASKGGEGDRRSKTWRRRRKSRQAAHTQCTAEDAGLLLKANCFKKNVRLAGQNNEEKQRQESSR